MTRRILPAALLLCACTAGSITLAPGPDAPLAGGDSRAASADAPVPVADGAEPVVDAPVTTADAPLTVHDAPLTVVDAPLTVVDAPLTVVDAPPTVVDAPVGVPDAPALHDAPSVDAPAPDASAPDAGLPPPTTCRAGSSPHAAVTAPVFVRGFVGRGDESWTGAAAVADLDRDGTRELIAARDTRLVVWRPDGTIKWQVTPSGGRIWASPVIGDFVGDGNLEVVVAARAQIFMYDAAGKLVAPFPVTWRDEVRAVAAADLDGDGALEIVAVTTNELMAGGQNDIIQVFRADGSVQPGYPPNTTGTSGCDTFCFVHGGFDQTLAIGQIDGDGKLDILAPQDNAYMSWHHGSGVAFDASSIFHNRKKVPGIRFMLDYALAQQGFGDAPDLQAHFTNSAPAIADLDGDGQNELVVVGSVQNVAQDLREQGVVLFVVRPDGTRPAAWVTPLHLPDYLVGLWDPDDNNIVAITNEAVVADLDRNVPGSDVVFLGYDGRIHRAGADGQERWSYTYTTDATVLGSGPVVADLTQDGVPEVVFTSYSTQTGKSSLFILDAGGSLQQQLALPGRGAMPAPTVADLDGDGQLEIIVALKDPDGTGNELLVFTVPGSGTACMPWPMNRQNLLRTGAAPR